MDISQVKPYLKNAKQHPDKQIEALANVVREIGWRQPVVVNQQGVIVVGHGRWMVWERHQDLPIWVIDDMGNTIHGEADKRPLSEEQEKMWRLADNQLNALTGFDMDLVVEELKEMSDEMIDMTGFDRDLLIEADQKDDEVPEVPDNPRSVIGDLYEIGSHRILCGDSTKRDDVEKLMHGKKADMVFTDPPYNVGYVGKTKEKLEIDNDEMTEANFRSFVDKFVENIFAFCNGVIYLCMSSSEWGTIQDSFKQGGGHWSRVIVWVKDRMVLSRADYHTQFEPIAVIDEDVNEEGEPILYGWKSGVRHFFKGGRKQTDIWRIERPLASREHPTMKPVQLIVRAITNNSLGNGLVMDLFLGSGSTVIASEKTGRICYGIEIDPKYVDVIVQRYVDYTGVTEVKKNGNVEIWEKKSK